ncbi:MAG: uracil-DNA glycosylase family protein [Bacteroidales bacterium]|nr:uracil-DNA glycosylase family protein [Bacteroidales bacterium]
MDTLEIEIHPLKPFLPKDAKVLMLGSFPPPQNRWSMNFFYPNLNNDMWRILGLIFYQDKHYFCTENQRSFKIEEIKKFLIKNRIALYDVASAIKRLKNNASDQFLEVVEPTDVRALLQEIPQCNTLVTTGKKATETLQAQFEVKEPKIGSFVTFQYEERAIKLYRMPSSSRAYPLSIEKKAHTYQKMFNEIGLL